jgi:16S rRNA G966 N2-methylase RsmD
MRLAAAEKMGYYPAASEAIADLVMHLAADKETHILDPCAGEGAAIKQIAESLGIGHDHVYCIELDAARGNRIKHSMPDAHVLSPCSFFSTAMMAGSFGLVYCNPPFDHQLGGGGREETEFARHCYRLLAPGGILVLVSPFSTFQSHELGRHLDCHYKEAAIYSFPDSHRPYHECAFIGVKRNVPISSESATEGGLFLSATRLATRYGRIYRESLLARLGQPQIKWDRGGAAGVEETTRIWTVPGCRVPLRFAKAGYTDEELIEALAASPINKHIMEVDEPLIKEPPLPLERGHVAMLLAAGALDGLVETPDGNHVVRGVATKIEVFNEEASDYTISDDGETAKTKEVFSQQITLKVRALDNTGTIYTFTAETAVATIDVAKEDVSYQDWELIQKLKMVTVANGATPGEEAAAQARLKAVIDRAKKEGPRKKTGTSG